MSDKTTKITSPAGDRRANRVVLGRSIFLMAIFGVVIFVPLLWKLWDLQIIQHNYLEENAVDQQTRDLLVTAPRGVIYDSKGNLLATSATVQNVVLSPRDIITAENAAKEAAEKAKGEGKTPAPNYQERTFIAQQLARILDVDEEKILERMSRTASQYEVIARRIGDEQAKQIWELIDTYKLYPALSLVPDTKRVYRYSSLAAQVVGWVNENDNNRGAYGIESYYESRLKGKPGRVVTAKNAAGTEMFSSYENYVDAIPGENLHLTIDANIQSYAERVLQEGIDAYEVKNGGFCIVMEPNTGAILAMVSSPDYDLNSPRTISDPILNQYLESVKNDPNSTEEAYNKALEESQYKQWRSKALNDTYEPGSTFKAIVLAAALEEGVVDENTTFNCTGVMQVADWPIKCSRRAPGHGLQNLRKAVMNSCNPAFIVIGQKLGAEKFYQYLEDFGMLEKTGIDLPEGNNASLVWDEKTFTSKNGLASLATASFGQRFQVTPIQLITGAAATINGGHLMQPYILSSVTDSSGNVISTTEPTEVRQVVSEKTSAQVRSILQSVVCDGGTGKNAYVNGYKVGGKTGTSETIPKSAGRYIVSFLGFAPADDPQFIMLIGFDFPTPAVPGANSTAGGFYISGGVMAANMAGELMGDILNYLGVEKEYSADELAPVTVPNVAGLSMADAESALKKAGLEWRTVGEGDAVTDQIPIRGVSIPGGSQVVLYLGAEKPTEQVQVPDVTGKSLEAAQNAMAKVGLYLQASGVTNYSAASVAVSQNVTAGGSVDPGTVVEVRFVDTSVMDYARGN